MGTTNFDKVDADELNVAGVDVTAAMAELATLDGLTATAAELNYAADVSATTQAVVPTGTGATTGTILATTKVATVASADVDHIVILPAPVVGKEIYLIGNDTGYELRSSAPATIGINGGTGASAESAIAASLLVHLVCVSATNWIGSTYTAAGVVGVVQVAA